MENLFVARNLRTGDVLIIESLQMGGAKKKVLCHRHGIPDDLVHCLDAEYPDAPLPKETLELSKADFWERFGDYELINCWEHLNSNRTLDLGCGYRIEAVSGDDSEMCAKFYLIKNGGDDERDANNTKQ